ncbi:JmjC-domain-containing protein [Ramicandelaber brevisporus]|nr:JmjC-domain-containing protein [Ramicandelaber brevisporus]
MYPGSSVLVFYPTMEEFANFEKFVTTIEPIAAINGICKVVPPAEWRRELEMNESEAAHLEKMKNCAFLEDSMYQVQQPIVQHFRGKDGILRLLNVDYYKPSLPLSEYFEMCVSIDHAPPSHLPCYPLRRRYEKNSAVKFRPLSSGTQSQQYVARHGGKVEQDYWQNITSESPMYGADISGSLFPPPEQFPVWNLRRLDSILNRVTISMTGINNPYLYIGMYRSTFAWHAEDLDMYSINYLHCGSPKSWFAIPLDQADDFEAFAKDQFPSSHRRCTEFIRHKSFHFSPSAISNSTLSGKDSDGAEIKHRTPVQAQRCVQNPGEFMITFPRGYHAGFNQGFNVAEAVNFAMPRWVQIGRRARVCQCSDESVRMEIDQWFPDQQVEDPVSIRVEHRKLVRRIWSIIAPLIEADRD